jgi:Fe-S oxidoreductase
MVSIVNKELVPPGLTYLADNVISKHNIMGAAKGTGAKWAKNLDLPKSGDTIFFAGCGYQYAKELHSMMSLILKIDKSAISTEMAMSVVNFQKKIGIDATGIFRKVMAKGDEADAEPLLDAVKVLRKLGVKFAYLGEDEPCCGGILHYIGLRKEFDKNAKQVYDNLKSRGVKRIISIVPSCTYTLRDLVADSVNSRDVEVKHFCEIVADNIASLNLRFPQKVKVTYHDPCQLGRYLGLIEQPRKILRAIKDIDFVETGWTKGEWATCCGGGGGFEAVFPELSQILAVNRAKELVETGAEIIVTHCPGCIMQLKTGLKELKADKVEVLDLAQVVAKAMGV